MWNEHLLNLNIREKDLKTCKDWKSTGHEGINMGALFFNFDS
jgi:hypothetical protein